MNETCCDTPAIHTEHLALRWRAGYTCFGGLFPCRVCSCCGDVVETYGWIKHFLFVILECICGFWDGAMCIGHSEDA